MAGFDGDEHIDLARSIRAAVESEGGHTRPYGEFRKRIAAAGISLSSTACSRLWRAAVEEAVTSEEDLGGEGEVEGEVELPPSQPEDAEEGLSLSEVVGSHFGPIQDNETLDDYEERLSQGLASVRRSEYEVAEKQMLQVLQQGHFYLEMKRLGLNASQVRTLLKGMGPRSKRLQSLSPTAT